MRLTHATPTSTTLYNLCVQSFTLLLRVSVRLSRHLQGDGTILTKTCKQFCTVDTTTYCIVVCFKGMLVSAPWRWRDNSTETCSSCVKGCKHKWQNSAFFGVAQVVYTRNCPVSLRLLHYITIPYQLLKLYISLFLLLPFMNDVSHAAATDTRVRYTCTILLMTEQEHCVGVQYCLCWLTYQQALQEAQSDWTKLCVF